MQLGIELYEDNARRTASGVVIPSIGKTLGRFGGVWDRKEKQYLEEALKKALRFGVHKGQREAFRFFIDWIDNWLCNETTYNEAGHAVRSILMVGGRRSGKTFASVIMSVIFAIVFPGAIVWLVSRSQPRSKELERYVKNLIPRRWRKYLGAPNYEFTLPNGSKIYMRSADDEESLRDGTADIVVLNEAHLIEERAYTICRGATVDAGGLVILAANPPRRSIGLWVADYYEECEAGRRPARVFRLDPFKNPYINHDSLRDIESETDKRTADEEIRGIIGGLADQVFYSYSPRLNVHEWKEPSAMDTFSEMRLGRPFDRVMTVDFQLTPHMASILWDEFRHPDDDRFIDYAVDEFVIEQASEDDLCDAWEAAGLDPKSIALIVDASGEWQDAERTKGRSSCDRLRARGWNNIFLPDRRMKKNPDMIDTIRAANARLKTADGKRHAYLHPDNTKHTQRALRKWMNRNGRPYRNSEYSHLGDCLRYFAWRMWPRREESRKIEAEVIKTGRTDRARDFEGVF